MSTVTRRKPRVKRQLDGERRWVIRDATWDDYMSLSKLLPESVRMAFDGSNLEIMVASHLHDNYADALDTFFKTIAAALGIAFSPYRSASWEKPKIQRSIQTDNSYYLDPAKIVVASAAIARKSRKASDYPTPDLAIEVDLSPPKADRESIYVALGVSELWIFDGTILTIKRLNEDGQYRPVEKSGFLPLRADQVPRWLLEDDRTDYDGWTQRIRAWAKRTLKKNGRRG
jgi:Uma2 family endonuclease